MSILQERTLERATRRVATFVDSLVEPGTIQAALAAIVELHGERVIGDRELFYFLGQVADGTIRLGFATDPRLTQLSQQLEQVERAHGLREDEFWRIGEAPPAWERVNAECEARMDAIVAEALRDAGLAEAAEMVERSPTDFENAGMAGRKEFEARWDRSQSQRRDPLSYFLDG